MKYIAQRLIVIAASLLVYSSCVSEDVPYDNSNESQVGDNVGYLEFSKMNIVVDLEAELVSKADLSDAPDDYIVTIYSQKRDEIVHTSTYGEIKNLSEPLSFETGTYTINVNSADNDKLADWNSPTYGCTKDVTIVKNITTEVGELTCKLSNIKTSVTIAANLNDLFQPDNGTEEDLNVSLSLGESTLNYSRGENRYGYFKAVEESNDLTIILSGMYNTAPADQEPSYEMISNWKKVITGVKAGQWRKVGIRIENSSSGNVTFVIDVQTWVYDENIDVDIMSQSYVFEEEILGDDTEGETSDPDAPVVTLANGHDIAEPFVISSSIFDFDAETCSDVIKSYITPAAGSTIESVDLTIDSNNKSLIAAISEAGFTESTISLLPTNTCEEYISIKSENGAVVATVKYDGMSSLYNYVGEHTVNVAATDSEGRTSHTSITINVVGADGDVTIEWRDGYSFDERHEISATTTLPVVIDIASESGITDFIIKINSKVLTVELLDELNLATTMDLIHPATPEMEKTLSDLQFPVGEEAIEGATTLKFDITSFMPLLASLGSGETDFELWVSDATGTTIRKIMLTTVSE